MWITSSHHLQHILGGFAIGFISDLTDNFLCGIETTILVAAALEVKDVLWTSKCEGLIRNILKWNWENFDFNDFAATSIGGTVGIIIGELIKIIGR